MDKPCLSMPNVYSVAKRDVFVETTPMGVIKQPGTMPCPCGLCPVGLAGTRNAFLPVSGL